MVSKPRIVAGEWGDICWDSGDWIIVDMGFAYKSNSCGVAIGCEEPQKLWFRELVKKVTTRAHEKNPKQLNLLLEAPLSMAFTKLGDPMPRTFEDLNHAWYRNSGAAMMLGSICLIDSVNSCERTREVRLFEGFATIPKTDHRKIAAGLRAVVQGKTEDRQDRIVKPSEIIAPNSGCLKPVYGTERGVGGVPPVIRLFSSDL